MGRAAAIGIFLRGLAMGAADVVPGVSGGTVALITGIYDRLLGAITHVDKVFVALVFERQWRAAWQHVDANFLLLLFAGIGTSVLLFAGLITHLMAAEPLLLWSFFSGLIAASGIFLLRMVQHWHWRTVAMLGAGIAVASWISVVRPIDGSESLVYFFGCGVIAICAMVLPGISGSFMLLLLGAYAPVMLAIKEFNLLVLVCFASGCALGLLSFARLMAWLLAQQRDAIMALLTGFLLGSLALVWPWKQTLSWYTSSHGELRPLQQSNVWPEQFAVLTGTDNELAMCVTLMLCGVALVYGLGVYGGRAASSHNIHSPNS